MQSFIALTLLKAEQTWVEDEKQTWKIFINIAQNKDNHESVSNLYWQFIHNKTHFWLKMYYLFDKTCVQHWKSAKISNLKKSDFGRICTTVSGLKAFQSPFFGLLFSQQFLLLCVRASEMLIFLLTWNMSLLWSGCMAQHCYFLRQHKNDKCDKCQTLHENTTHWVLPVHTSCG